MLVIRSYRRWISCSINQFFYPIFKSISIRVDDPPKIAGRHTTKLINARKDSLILYHNHPYSGSFSYADIGTLNKYESLKEMLAVGHNGAVYSLKVGKRLTEEELKDVFASFDTESEVLKKLVKKYKWAYNENKGR